MYPGAVIRRVCVFLGSSKGARPAYERAATTLGTQLAQRGQGLVYGGASVGLMGAVADACLDAGGEVIGVIPEALRDRELAHGGLTALHVVPSMHARKAKMAELADAFVALPGGVGTLEELTEVLTWAQLGIHAKPCAVLDVEGYYTPLLSMFDRMVAEGFLRAEHRSLLLAAAEPGALLDALTTARTPHVAKWMDDAET